MLTKIRRTTRYWVCARASRTPTHPPRLRRADKEPIHAKRKGHNTRPEVKIPILHLELWNPHKVRPINTRKEGQWREEHLKFCEDRHELVRAEVDEGNVHVEQVLRVIARLLCPPRELRAEPSELLGEAGGAELQPLIGGVEGLAHLQQCAVLHVSPSVEVVEERVGVVTVEADAVAVDERTEVAHLTGAVAVAVVSVCVKRREAASSAATALRAIIIIAAIGMFVVLAKMIQNEHLGPAGQLPPLWRGRDEVRVGRVKDNFRFANIDNSLVNVQTRLVRRDGVIEKF